MREGKKMEESKSLCLLILKEIRRLVEYRVKNDRKGNESTSIYMIVVIVVPKRSKIRSVVDK